MQDQSCVGGNHSSLVSPETSPILNSAIVLFYLFLGTETRTSVSLRRNRFNLVLTIVASVSSKRAPGCQGCGKKKTVHDNGDIYACISCTKPIVGTLSPIVTRDYVLDCTA